MPLTKQYLRYKQTSIANVAPAHRCELFALHSSDPAPRHRNSQLTSESDVVIFAFGEYVHFWNLRSWHSVGEIRPSQSAVSVIALDASDEFVGVGCADGTVASYRVVSKAEQFTTRAHTACVTAIAYSSDAILMASGGLDCQIVIWDQVAQYGVCRLRGHHAPITDLHFTSSSPQRPFLFSSSKDTTVRVWDLDSYHCTTTIAGHAAEISRFLLVDDDATLITTSTDAELRVFTLSYRDEDAEQDDDDDGKIALPVAKAMRSSESSASSGGGVVHTYRGAITRQRADAVKSMRLVAIGSKFTFALLLLTSHGIEQFKLSCGSDLDSQLKRFSKKQRKKSLQAASKDDSDPVETPPISDFDRINQQVKAFEWVKPPRIPKAKLRGFCFFNAQRIGFLLDNTLVIEKMNEKSDAAQPVVELQRRVFPAHESDVRTLAFSSDSQLVVSGSARSVIVWNINSVKPIVTLPSPYCVSSAFLPAGNRFFVIGTRDGRLLTFDLVTASCCGELDSAHDGPIWAIAIAPNGNDLVTASEDKTVKFWKIFTAVKSGEVSSGPTFDYRLDHAWTVEDGVTALRFAANRKQVAVALLDNTIRVHFADTLKFSLNLYGHNLPALCIDISSDSRLLVSGSADKNVRIWGLDFGDCRRSIFAHDDAITAVVFVPGTHMFFSAARDGSIKQWDADRFERIVTLDDGGRHQAEVWSLAITPTACDEESGGAILVSASHDKTIRVWRQSEELLVLDEQREMEREREAEEVEARRAEPIILGEASNAGLTALRGIDGAAAKANDSDDRGVDVVPARSTSSMDSIDRLVEALRIYEEETEARNAATLAGDSAPVAPENKILQALGGISAQQYFLNQLRRITPAELQVVLLSLPRACVRLAINALLDVLDGGGASPDSLELALRSIMQVVKLNATQICSAGAILAGSSTADDPDAISAATLERLRVLVSDRANRYRDMVSFNQEALRFLADDIAERGEEQSFFADAIGVFAEKQKRRRQRQAATITMN